MITGHSLGGALATIAGFDFFHDTTLTDEFGEKWDRNLINVVTFAAPRVGNEAFAKKFASTIGVANSLRITSGYDMVPALPPYVFGYRHVPHEIWF